MILVSLRDTGCDVGCSTRTLAELSAQRTDVRSAHTEKEVARPRWTDARIVPFNARSVTDQLADTTHPGQTS
jgi:hypothetical protein